MFTVQTPHNILHFQQINQGLYYHNCAPGQGAVTLLQTVEGNAEVLTAWQIEEERQARAAYRMVVRPSPQDSDIMIRGGMICNYPVTPAHLKVDNSVFGPNRDSICGNTVRRKPDSVMTDYVAVPLEIIERNIQLVVSVDLMYVNQIPILITVGNWVKFITAENLTDRKSRTLLND